MNPFRALGDFTYGFISYALSGQFTWDGLFRFILATLLAAVVFAAFLILVNSLAFWFGIVSSFANLMVNAIVTFGIYPITLFDNYAKLILFTLVPAALMGAVPADFIAQFTWRTLAELLLGRDDLPRAGNYSFQIRAEAVRIWQCDPGGGVVIFSGIISARDWSCPMVDEAVGTETCIN